VTTAARFEGAPDIPTVRDFLPGYEASMWWGFGATKNTPADIVDKLNKEVSGALADPKNVLPRIHWSSKTASGRNPAHCPALLWRLPPSADSCGAANDTPE
jgi:tripartite-type tricarboxylate transporter receptor subunit TctC